MDSELAHAGYRSGVHHIVLQVPAGTEEKVRAFYCDVLGMSEVPMEGGRAFRFNDLEFDFEVEPGIPVPAPRLAHPGTLVKDIDALATRLAVRGIDVEWDDKFPGYRRFYTRDPLGNRLEFLQQKPVTAAR